MNRFHSLFFWSVAPALGVRIQLWIDAMLVMNGNELLSSVLCACTIGSALSTQSCNFFSSIKLHNSSLAGFWPLVNPETKAKLHKNLLLPFPTQHQGSALGNAKKPDQSFCPLHFASTCTLLIAGQQYHIRAITCFSVAKGNREEGENWPLLVT